MVNHAPKIRWWRRERPEAFANTAKWVTPGGYVAGRLAGLDGREAFMDRTYLHFSALADTRAGEWSERLAGAAGAEPAQLPRILEPTTVIGELTPRCRGGLRTSGRDAGGGRAGGHRGGDAGGRRRPPGTGARLGRHRCGAGRVGA